MSGTPPDHSIAKRPPLSVYRAHTVALATLPGHTPGNSCLLGQPPRLCPRRTPYLLERCSSAPLARRLRWPGAATAVQ